MRLINGHGFKPQEWSDSGLPIIRIQNLNGSPQFNYFNGEVDEKFHVMNGDLLFACADAPALEAAPVLVLQRACPERACLRHSPAIPSEDPLSMRVSRQCVAPIVHRPRSRPAGRACKPDKPE